MIRTGAIIGLFLLGGMGLLWVSSLPEPLVPTFQEVQAAHRPSDAILLDRSREIIHEIRLDFSQRRLGWTALSDISPALQKAVVASEDQRFSQHRGVDGKALLAAGIGQVLERSRGGASTISMQLVTLIDPGLRMSSGGRKKQSVVSQLRQKWRQMQLAWALERQWSKREILEAYLNLVPFRGELEGVAAAAHVLLGKTPQGISETEALVLAVLLRAPNAGQDLVSRRASLLQKKTATAASPEEVAKTVARALDASARPGPRVSLASHVASRLLQPMQVDKPVRSALDVVLQRVTIATLRHHLLAVRARRVQDGAVLVVDNATGEVLAYVGSSGGLSRARYVDGVRARRQAGSTLKPFLYGLAFEQRLLTPASLLEDTAFDLAAERGLYRPQNYDRQFRGLVTVRTALGASLNIPAVRTLALVGTEPFVQRLRQLGFAGITQSGDYYGPALALGSAEVSLWELVNAYRTLANGGVWSPLRLGLDEVQRAKDKVRSPQSESKRRLYAEGTAFLLSHILADRESRSATFGLENALATRFWSAVKTGTSKDMRDNWCVGYSQRYTVGVWVGNFSGEPMRDVSGMTGAAPIWLSLMAELHRTTPSLHPHPPGDVLRRTLAFSGNIEPQREEWFLTGTEPQLPIQELAKGSPRILLPVAGTVIALDPDIPPSQQRVIFEARGGNAETRWILNGTDISPAAGLVTWTPAPGKFTLSLRAANWRAIDTVHFEVRGQ